MHTPHIALVLLFFVFLQSLVIPLLHFISKDSIAELLIHTHMHTYTHTHMHFLSAVSNSCKWFPDLHFIHHPYTHTHAKTCIHYLVQNLKTTVPQDNALIVFLIMSIISAVILSFCLSFPSAPIQLHGACSAHGI